MKSRFQFKARFVTLLMLVVFFLIPCNRLFGGTVSDNMGTLSGNMKMYMMKACDMNTGEATFHSLKLSGKEVLLLKYDDSLSQKDKKSLKDVKTNMNIIFEKECYGKRVCDSNKHDLTLKDYVEKRNNAMLPYIIQKTTTNKDGLFAFPEKISYGKYLLCATRGQIWWLVPVVINHPQTEMDLTEKNIYDSPNWEKQCYKR